MHGNLDENLLRARARDLAGQSGIPFETSGGYETAERQILVFQPDYLEGVQPDWDEYLHVLHIAAAKEGLDHRDYLGAILALGMKRDQLGDILVLEKSARIILLSGISEYLSLNMERVGSTRVKITRESLADLVVPDDELITVHGNVSSLRLDNVAAEGFNLPRSEMADLIRGGQVNLNFVQEQRADRNLKPGDMISLRGYGRVHLVSIDGRSRKDRFFITLDKTK